MQLQSLIDKYNQAVPRYTSYPTVPHWQETQIDEEQWKASIFENYQQEKEEGISLYIHLPYCESLCTYCGCNKRITKNHQKESPYIESLIAEWRQYEKLLGGQVRVKNLHLGGGTPTFFSAENLKYLMEQLLKGIEITQNPSLSFEGHPNNTTYEHLKALASVGFNRVSYGVQDFDLGVQKAINRIQSFEQVQKVTGWSRELGYKSINFDLVYGLPFQTKEAVAETIEKVKTLFPDRIALYSYAHVPWKSKSQRGFSVEDLPEAKEKLNMYLMAKKTLQQAGYENIGMDHFAQPNDELAIAKKSKRLNRNFMGYTADGSKMMIGIGNSSISFSGNAFAQNEKGVEDYQEIVEAEKIPLTKGHFLTEEEQVIAEVIKELICNESVKLQSPLEQHLLREALNDLQIMEQEGLLHLTGREITIKKEGMLFVRNICALFDTKLKRAQSERLFSKAI